MYARPVHHADIHQDGLLLEQARIPWPHAYQALISALQEQQVAAEDAEFITPCWGSDETLTRRPIMNLGGLAGAGWHGVESARSSESVHVHGAAGAAPLVTTLPSWA